MTRAELLAAIDGGLAGEELPQHRLLHLDLVDLFLG